MSIGGEQEVFDAALSGGEMPGVVDESVVDSGGASAAASSPENEDPGHNHPSPNAETPPEGVKKPENEAFVPSWRLREVAEEKRRLEQEAAELRAWKEKTERERQEAEKKANPPDMFENPDEFLKVKTAEALDPVQKALEAARAETRKTVEHWSRVNAFREHGQEKVEAAYKALDEAIRRGELDGEAVGKQLQASPDPFGEIVAWHRKYEFEREVGNDPQGWMERQKEALLKDPEFLAKALEAARTQAASVTTTTTAKGGNVTSLPSLNRTPRAGTEVDEPEDPAEVFNAALNAGRR